MSAGTLTLTNNSAAVTGSGTAFTTELAAGDFIVVTVGGVPYTLPVKTINSNTSATLVSNFTGPTQSGSAWYAVPRIAMNLVTAAAVTQAAEALRGLNYDKQNWQSVFSATGNITVTLPDGSTFSGPSWKYLSDNMVTKVGGVVPVNQGGTGATSEEDARKNLGLDNFGNAATYNVGTSGDTIPVLSNGATWGGTLRVSTSGEEKIEIVQTRIDGSELGSLWGYNCGLYGGSAYFKRSYANNDISAGQVFISLPLNGGTLALTGTSDKTYKHDINDMDPLESVRNIQRMRPVTFIFNNDPDKTVRRGVIAQEIQKIDPEYVHLNIDPTDEEGITKERLSLDNNALLLDALIAIKNLADRVEELEGK